MADGSGIAVAGAGGADRPRVALLVDGDNLSHDHAGELLREASRLGTVAVRRVYADLTLRPGWTAAPGFRGVHAGAGKNAADVLLAIEAVALSFGGVVDAFAVASSDRDFAHLAHHLRERGFAVTGLGEAKAPEAFRAACSRFVVIDGDGAHAFEAAVVAEIRAHGRVEGLRIGVLGARLGTKGFRIRDMPEKSWDSFFKARPTVFACSSEGEQALVKLHAP